MENVHTYKHARRVYKSPPQSHPLRHATYQMPDCIPSNLGIPDFIPSEFGPPVQTPADFIALRYLSQHHPLALQCRTEQVLSSVDDKEFEEFDKKYTQPKKQKKPKRSLVECLKARYPEAQIPAQSNVSVKQCEPSISTSASHFNLKYGKPITSDFWKSTRSKTQPRTRLSPVINIPPVCILEEVFETVEGFETPVIPHCHAVESIQPSLETVEHIVIPVLEAPVICSAELPTDSPIVSCDDVPDLEPLGDSQPLSSDTMDSNVALVPPRSWRKRPLLRHIGVEYALIRLARAVKRKQMCVKFDEVEWNYKKRRRCEY